MTDRAQPKQTPIAHLPTHSGEGDRDREALAHAVRDHRRAVEETVEALKTKLSRATDSVEHARERVEGASDYLRQHRWPALGAAVALGLLVGLRRRYAAPIQLMLPSGEVLETPRPRKRSLFAAAISALGGLIIRELGMRAMAVVEEKLVGASNPPEPPIA